MNCGYCGERKADLIDGTGVASCRECDGLGRDPVALERELLIADYMLDRLCEDTPLVVN